MLEGILLTGLQPAAPGSGGAVTSESLQQQQQQQQLARQPSQTQLQQQQQQQLQQHRAVDLFSHYINLTGDVQTAVLVLLHVVPKTFKDPRVENWVKM